MAMEAQLNPATQSSIPNIRAITAGMWAEIGVDGFLVAVLLFFMPSSSYTKAAHSSGLFTALSPGEPSKLTAFLILTLLIAFLFFYLLRNPNYDFGSLACCERGYEDVERPYEKKSEVARNIFILHAKTIKDHSLRYPKLNSLGFWSYFKNNRRSSLVISLFLLPTVALSMQRGVWFIHPAIFFSEAIFSLLLRYFPVKLKQLLYGCFFCVFTIYSGLKVFLNSRASVFASIIRLSLDVSCLKIILQLFTLSFLLKRFTRVFSFFEGFFFSQVLSSLCVFSMISFQHSVIFWKQGNCSFYELDLNGMDSVCIFIGTMFFWLIIHFIIIYPVRKHIRIKNFGTFSSWLNISIAFLAPLLCAYWFILGGVMCDEPLNSKDADTPILWVIKVFLPKNQREFATLILWFGITASSIYILWRISSSADYTAKNKVVFKNLLRKMFHLLLAFIVFLGLLLSRTEVLIAALSGLLWILFFFEGTRLAYRADNAVLSAHLEDFFYRFADSRDHGGIIFTHFSLLLGVGFPIIFEVIQSGISDFNILRGMSGVFTVGIADATASIIGLKYGKRKLWLSERKSVIGLLAFIFTAILSANSVTFFFPISREDWRTSCVSFVLSAFYEAFTVDVDNLGTSLYAYAAFNIIKSIPRA